MKTPCPTCDRPIDPNKPCGDCSTLALFGRLPRPDRRGRAALGYSLHPLDLEDWEPEPENRPLRFLCLSDHSVLVEGDVDCHGVEVTGRDKYGPWLGTLDAPVIVPGGDTEQIVRIHGRQRWDGGEWTGNFIGSERAAIRAIPADVAVEFVEHINVERRWL